MSWGRTVQVNVNCLSRMSGGVLRMRRGPHGRRWRCQVWTSRYRSVSATWVKNHTLGLPRLRWARSTIVLQARRCKSSSSPNTLFYENCSATKRLKKNNCQSRKHMLVHVGRTCNAKKSSPKSLNLFCSVSNPWTVLHTWCMLRINGWCMDMIYLYIFSQIKLSWKECRKHGSCQMPSFVNQQNNAKQPNRNLFPRNLFWTLTFEWPVVFFF